MTPDRARRVLVAGYSTRAIAESAARAGFEVTAIDAFADLDQHPGVTALAVDPFTPLAAAHASRAVACDAVAYLSSFENHPDAVRSLACGRELWGNSPEVLLRVRNPNTLAEALSSRGLTVPRLGGDGEGQWLVKPRASGGGTRITPWDRGQPIAEEDYLQEFIEGEPGSVAFVASAGHVRVLGIFQQLMGLAAFGAAGYRYCGSILDRSQSSGTRLLAAAELARAAASEFSLTGVNGIDFVARGDALLPIEINPRWSASMELVERAYGVSVFGAHANACADGALPEFDATMAPSIGRTIGKAVVFARSDITVADTSSWCSDVSVRDIPRPGTFIRAGEPVCTVFGDGATVDACRAALETRATVVFEALERWAWASA